MNIFLNIKEHTKNKEPIFSLPDALNVLMVLVFALLFGESDEDACFFFCRPRYFFDVTFHVHCFCLGWCRVHHHVSGYHLSWQQRTDRPHLPQPDSSVFIVCSKYVNKTFKLCWKYVYTTFIICSININEYLMNFSVEVHDFLVMHLNPVAYLVCRIFWRLFVITRICKNLSRR